MVLSHLDDRADDAPSTWSCKVSAVPGKLRAEAALNFAHVSETCLQVAFLAIMSTSTDWTRRRTPKSDEWVYLPTVYPADSFITMRPCGQ